MKKAAHRARSAPAEVGVVSAFDLFDQNLIWVVVGLLAWSVVMVYSSTIALPDSPKYEGISDTYFVVRHLISICVGLIAAGVAVTIPMSVYRRLAIPLFLLCLMLLVAVLIPGVGRGVNGAHRWIPVGLMSFQPSELAKFAVAMYAADFMVRRMEVRESFGKAVAPVLAALALIGALLLAEPDMGAFIVIAFIALGVLFVGGVNFRAFILVAALFAVVFAGMVVFSPWRLQRFMAFLDPFDPNYAMGKGYQLSHSLIAMGRGQFFGVGLGGSVEKLNWLPEAHTDFIMAIIGEEMGFVGVFVFIAAFFWLVRRIVLIGRRAIDIGSVFDGLLCQGFAIGLGAQAAINIGVCVGALPTKGLTLPLMSYGGSAIVMTLVSLAVVLRVDFENRRRSVRRVDSSSAVASYYSYR